MVSCGMSCIKYVLFTFNLIFAISGIGIIAAGALVIANIEGFSHFLETRVIAPPIVLIVAGAIVFIIAFLGCYGAIKEHYNMLIAFSLLLLIIFVIELAVGIAAAVFKNDFDVSMRKSLDESIRNYTDVDKLSWDKVQMQLNCCGIDKHDDWLRNIGFERSKTLPQSCCEDIQPGDICYQNSQNVHDKGCFEVLREIVQKSATVLIGVGIGIAFIEIAGIILACCLASAIKKEGDK